MLSENGDVARKKMERKIRRSWSGKGSSLPSPHAFFALRFTISAHHYLGTWNRLKKLQPVAKYLRHCTAFWLKWPVHDPVLVIPPPPLIKVALLQYKTMLQTWRNNFGWTGGRRSVLYLTDLWLATIWSKKGGFLVGVSQYFCSWL